MSGVIFHNDNLTRYHEIGLGVEVATKGIVAVAFQGLQALS